MGQIKTGSFTSAATTTVATFSNGPTSSRRHQTCDNRTRTRTWEAKEGTAGAENGNHPRVPTVAKSVTQKEDAKTNDTFTPHSIVVYTLP